MARQQILTFLAIIAILIASLLARPAPPEKSLEAECAGRCYPNEPDLRRYDGELICYCGTRRFTARSP